MSQQYMTDENQTFSILYVLFSLFVDACDGDYLMLRNGDDLATSPLILIHPGNYCYDLKKKNAKPRENSPKMFFRSIS